MGGPAMLSKGTSSPSNPCASPDTLSLSALPKVFESRLRSFDGAGTRVRTMMLERLAAVLTRLRTFELIGGGQGYLLNESTAAEASGDAPGVDDAHDGGAIPLLAADAGAGHEKASDDLDKGGAAATGAPGDAACHADASVKERRLDGGGPCSPLPTNQIDRPGGAANSSRDALCASQTKEGKGVRAKKDSVGHGGGDDSVAMLKAQQARVEVTRWLQFLGVDLVTFVGAALQAGDVHAASIVWRRHGRTDRGLRGSPGHGNEGQSLAAALPDQLAALPASAPTAPLGSWLRDDVLPALDVASAMTVSVCDGSLVRE